MGQAQRLSEQFRVGLPHERHEHQERPRRAMGRDCAPHHFGLFRKSTFEAVKHDRVCELIHARNAELAAKVADREHHK